jgi:hypothetical protein
MKFFTKNISNIIALFIVLSTFFIANSIGKKLKSTTLDKIKLNGKWFLDQVNFFTLQ